MFCIPSIQAMSKNRCYMHEEETGAFVFTDIILEGIMTSVGESYF